MEEKNVTNDLSEADKVKRDSVAKFLQFWNQIWQEAPVLFYKKGQTLFYQKHLPYGAYILIHGQIRLVAEEKNQENGLELMPMMEPFGLDLIAMEWANPCTAVVEEDAAVLFIPKTLLQQVRTKR